MTRPLLRHTRRRPMTVAFVEIESMMQRTWRQAGTGVYDGPKGRDLDRWWCAADAPLDARAADFALRRVCRTGKIPAEATCEECGCSIAELRELLSESLA